MHLRDLDPHLLALATRNPNERLLLGVERDLGHLPDPSLDAARDTAQEAQRLLALLDTARADSFDDHLDRDLTRLYLRREHLLHTLHLDGAPERARKPTAGADLGDGAFHLFIADHLPLPERLDALTQRIEATEDYLDALLRRLDTPVTRWVQIEQERVTELPDLFHSIARAAEHTRWSDTPRLLRATARACDALQRYQRALAALPTQDNLHVGPALTRQLIQARGIDLTPEELHRVAADFLQRNAAQIEALRDTLTRRYHLPPDTSAADLHHHLNARFAAPIQDGRLEDILDLYRQEHQRLLDFIQQRDLFPLFPQQDLRIIRTPAFLESTIPAGAMCPPPPFRDGTRTSLVYLTLSNDLLDEHTRIAIPSMMIHEGVPGHHLQFATASLHTSTIRRLLDAADLSEGWTTMLEDYMLDLGYMGDLTDEARFVTLRELARLGARVGIDLFFMSGERAWLDLGTGADLRHPDPFQAAASLLRHVTGFTPARTRAELNWYSLQRTYPLAYLTGNHLVWRLKRAVQAANPHLQGLELDRRFHRTYLEAGNMPVSSLVRVFHHAGLLPQPHLPPQEAP